jgi:hypothetical protein
VPLSLSNLEGREGEDHIQLGRKGEGEGRRERGGKEGKDHLQQLVN